MSAAILIQNEVNTVHQTCSAFSMSVLIKAAHIPKHLMTCYVYSYPAQYRTTALISWTYFVLCRVLQAFGFINYVF